MDKFGFIKDEKLQKQIKFAIVIDEMKNIFRRNLIIDGSRRENDAEHSWNLAMLAMLFEEYSTEKVNIERVLKSINFDNTKFTVSSNAYWACDISSTRKMLEKLHDMSFQQIEISYDEYHAKFIPFQNIVNVIEEAKQIGIDIKIVMSISNNYSYIPFYIKLCKLLPKRNIILQRVAWFGNARKNEIDSFISADSFVGKKCRQLFNPCINYRGDIFACCGPGVISESESLLYVSNLEEEDLTTALKKMMSNETLLKINENGPMILCTESSKQKKYSSLCELCMRYEKMA